MSAKRKQQMLVHEHDQRVHRTGETVKNMNTNTEFGARQLNPYDRVVVRGHCGLASAMGETVELLSAANDTFGLVGCPRGAFTGCR